jgi:formate dehydrogenase beta subunit
VADVNRRDFFRRAGGGVAALVAASSVAEARPDDPQAPPDAVGLLYDTTICIGCKACVVGCSEANGMPPDTRNGDGLWQAPIDLNSRTKNIIKIWRDEELGLFSFMKHQCMHCLEPACVAGCPYGALERNPTTGIVEWREKQCIGCRYCEVACPYNVPKFEWDKFNPRIVKCQLCDHRLAEGKEPGCTDACPTGAVIFGKRSDLLIEAKRRVGTHPGKYYEDRVYGEDDIGGTQCLYLSHVPFEKIGLPELGRMPVPERAKQVHQWFTNYGLMPLALYALFTGVIKRNWKEHDEESRVIEETEGLRDQI